VCSIFDTGLIPPTVNISTPNPAIAWEKYRLVVPSRITRMPSKQRHLVAMTSSGIGGANGHCVVQGPPAARVGTRSSFWRGEVKPHAFLVVVGGLSPRSTSAIFDAVRASLSHSTAADIARTYNRVARSMTWRSWSLAVPGQDLRFSEPVLLPKERKPLVFIYSGQGPQHLESE
jgi:acyl transferase domain-containing protein